MKIKNLLGKAVGIGSLVLAVYACSPNKDKSCSSPFGNCEPPIVTYQCNDNQDNDSDGKVDYPSDLGCSSLTDNDEYNAPVNQPPVITSTPSLEVMVKDNYTYDINADDPDGDALTYYLTQNPAGMIIDPITGLIQFQTNYSNLGRNNVIIVVDDSKATAEQSFTLNVKYNYNHFGTPLQYAFVMGSPDNEKVIVCENPCSRTEDSFNTKASGIILGSDALENLIGTTPVTNNFPIEFHLENDIRCPSGTGGSANYLGWTNSFICLYTYNKVDEGSLNAQELPIHEEAHLNFRERANFSGEEDFVRALAAIITDHSGDMQNLDSFRDPRMLNISKFMYDLCIRHGFDTNYIKPFFQELISESQIKGDSLTTFEVIYILNLLTGQNTTQTFIDNNLL